MTLEILKEVSADEQLRTRIRFQEKAERDRRARLNSYWQEGIEQGERQRSVEIAQRMLGSMDDAAIAHFTGLSPQEVTELRSRARL